ARGWIERVHPEADRLAPLELIVQETVAWVAGGIKVDDIAEEDQAIAAGLSGEGRGSQRRDQDERGAVGCVFHAPKVTESASLSKRKERRGPHPCGNRSVRSKLHSPR